MKTTVWILGLAGALLIALTTMASAETIYSHGLIPADNYGFMSNIDGDLSADNFEITDDYLIESITWYGMYDPDDSTMTDTFDIKIYNSSEELLFEALRITSVSKTDTGLSDYYGATIYNYDLTVSGWQLSSGEYLISISNENSVFSDWYWADGEGGDDITYYSVSGGWAADDTTGVDLAFSLDGEIVQTAPAPEPGTILLFGLGLLVTAFSGRAGRHI